MGFWHLMEYLKAPFLVLLCFCSDFLKKKHVKNWSYNINLIVWRIRFFVRQSWYYLPVLQINALSSPPSYSHFDVISLFTSCSVIHPFIHPSIIIHKVPSYLKCIITLKPSHFSLNRSITGNSLFLHINSSLIWLLEYKKSPICCIIFGLRPLLYPDSVLHTPAVNV